MEQYKANTLEEEQLLLVVTSTFGNGDCPSNGQVGSRDTAHLGAEGLRRTKKRAQGTRCDLELLGPLWVLKPFPHWHTGLSCDLTNSSLYMSDYLR